jgi:anti-sigma factor RsiW
MNCTSFKDLLFEYLDGELSPDEQTLAAEHLTGCPECRNFLEHEKASGNKMSKVFEERTRELRLSPGFERRVLEKVEAAVAGRRLDGLLAIVRRFSLPVAAAAVAVVVAAVFLVRGHTPSDAVHQASVEGGGEKVQATFISAVYTFRLEGDRVVDLVEYRTNVVDGVVLLSRN